MFFSILLLASIAAVRSTYVVTCHNNNECGTTCGYYSNDIVAPTEGLFGTSCWCQSGQVSKRCGSSFGDIYVCSDYKPPSCQTACGQQICVYKDGRKATATVLSACPKFHPQNTQQCCSNPSSRDYCTCVIQDTLDMNAYPYSQLGNTNGYSSNAVWGACASRLESLQIHINSTRASELVKPFLVKGDWCKMKEAEYREAVEVNCYGLDESQCGANPACTFCKSSTKRSPTDCYNRREAEVLSHIFSVEDGADKFSCTPKSN